MKNGDLFCPSIFLKRFVRLLFCASSKMSSKTCNILKIPAPKVCSLLFLFRVLRAWHKKITHNNLIWITSKFALVQLSFQKSTFQEISAHGFLFVSFLFHFFLFFLLLRVHLSFVFFVRVRPVHFCHVEENNILNANVQH